MPAAQVALAHYRQRARLVRAVELLAVRLWSTVDPADIAGSWAVRMPAMYAGMTAAQRQAAAAADSYVTAVLAAQDAAAPAVGRVGVEALVGVASDGRPLATLLQQPVVTARVSLSRGASVISALASGRAALQMIASTQVADAGRVADQVASVARRTGGYVRMTSGGTCSRCLILAGKWFRWNQGFARHPRCDCVHIPTSENRAGDVRTNPKQAFAAMTGAEQDRTFGKAGAAAIRDGSDMARVVNARSGMYTAGGRQYTTANTRGGTARLMPEQIYRDAAGDQERAITMLRRHGYIT